MRTVIAALLMTLLPMGLVAAPSRLLRHPAPSPDGSQIVFSYQGDLWSVAAAGGDARRLTVHPAVDRYPVWSRDGRWIAFASDRHGNSDVFVVPADWSEAPRRLTFASVPDIPVDFTPDCQAVLFTSRRLESMRRSPALFSVPITGGTPHLLQPELAHTAQFSPDGSSLAFVRGSTPWSRRGYLGSGNRDIWLRKGTQPPTQLTDFAGDDDRPAWIDDNALVFLSARSGRKNLFRIDLTTGQTRPLTVHDQTDVRFPSASADGRMVAYEFNDAIWTTSTSTPAPRQVAIQLPADVARNAIERRVDTSGATELAVSPDGKRVAIVVHGDVLVVASRTKDEQEIAKAPTLQVTATPGREQGVRWSSDGRTLLFSSDRTGVLNLYLASHSGKAADWDASVPPVTRLTHATVDDRGGIFSPDNSHVAFIRGNGDLMTIAVDGSNEKTLFEHWSESEIVWSPDSRWIAYATDDVEFNSDVWIVAADGTSPPYNVSRHPDIDQQPHWSADGRRLLWVSLRHGNSPDIWSVWLRRGDHERTAESWLAYFKEVDKTNKKAGKNDADKPGEDGTSAGSKNGDKKPKQKDRKRHADDELAMSDRDDEPEAQDKPAATVEVVIDFDDLWRRSTALTSLEAAESSPLVSSDGKTVFFIAAPDGERDLYSVRWDGKERTRLTTEGAKPTALQSDRDGTLYYLTSKGAIKRLDGKGKAGDPLPFEAHYAIDHDAERAAVFEEAWRTIGARFYDPAMHGVDWSAVRQRFRPLALAAAHESDFADVINLMLGELNASHLGYFSPGDDADDLEATGWLGVLVDPTAGGPGLLIREVLLNSPGARQDVVLKPGERLLAIDDTPVDVSHNMYQPLVGKVKRSVQLRVRDAAGVERTVAVEPTDFASASQRRYEQWTRERAAIVERLSGGRLGYIHIQGMSIPSFEDFERDLYAAGHGKDGLVIDVRSNGGGWTTDYLMAVLNVRRHARTVPRGADPATHAYPQSRLPLAAWTRPAMALCNEDSYSNAEIFSSAFKVLGRGLTVGVPTFGAVISTGSTQLLNGASLRLPFRGWYVAGTDVNMENNGFVPDFIVTQPPDEDTSSDRDTQLARAVELFLEYIERDPRRHEW